jgi:hypothetical protein
VFSRLIRSTCAPARLLFWGLLLCGACNTSSGALLGGEQEAQKLPGIKVDLPPPPSFAEPNIALQYPDGTMSIYGLRKHLNKYLGQQVKVKAYLLEMYQCPVCPKKMTCKACDQPHFFLTDEPNGKKEKGLLVADYRMAKAKDPKLTPGKQYVIDGTFNRNTPGGFAASDGLLVFSKMIDDTGKEYLGPAEELQRKAEAGAAQEKAAYEKAMKAKVQK